MKMFNVKDPLKQFTLAVAALAAFCRGGGLCRAAETPTLTVTPAVTSNTHPVQVATNLAATNGVNLQNFQLQSNYFPIVDNQAPNRPRFYRIRKN